MADNETDDLQEAERDLPAQFESLAREIAANGSLNDDESKQLIAAAAQFVVAVHAFKTQVISAGLLVEDYRELITAARDLVYEDEEDDEDEDE